MSIHLILARDSRVRVSAVLVSQQRRGWCRGMNPKPVPRAPETNLTPEETLCGGLVHGQVLGKYPESTPLSALSRQQRQVLCRGMNPKPVPSAPKTTVTLEDIFRSGPVHEEALGKAL